jgi:hypothetical protein
MWLFHDYTPVTPGDQSVKLSNHHMLAIKGHSTIHTFTYVKGRQVNIVLHDITHVPNLHTNILSPNALTLTTCTTSAFSLSLPWPTHHSTTVWQKGSIKQSARWPAP